MPVEACPAMPGVTAMLAAAALAGAPLGHDFCAINLSDNLKPWPVIEKRLRLRQAGEHDRNRGGHVGCAFGDFDAAA